MLAPNLSGSLTTALLLDVSRRFSISFTVIGSFRVHGEFEVILPFLRRNGSLLVNPMNGPRLNGPKSLALSPASVMLWPSKIFVLPSGMATEPFPCMAFTKDPIFVESLFPKSETRKVHACLLAESMTFSFQVAALLHSDLAAMDKGEFFQILNRFRAFFTALAHLSSHQGLLGSSWWLSSGFYFLKCFQMALSNTLVKDSTTPESKDLLHETLFLSFSIKIVGRPLERIV